MISSDSKRFTRMQTGVLLAAILLILMGFLSPYLFRTPKPLLDLSKFEWNICFTGERQDCSWFTSQVPGDIKKEKFPAFNGRVLYEVNFPTPKFCTTGQNLCTLYISEIGDAASISLNSRLLGKNGEVLGEGRYAKHYPVQLSIPKGFLNSDSRINTLQIEVRSFKNVQAGIRRGPVGLFEPNAAHFFFQLEIAQSILIPLVSAFILLLIATFALGWSFFNRTNSHEVQALLIYCAIMSAFLFSISEIPREFIKVSWAGLIHHTLRLLGDLSYYHLIYTFFFFGNRRVNSLKFFYWLTLSICPLFSIYFFASGQFDSQIFDHTYLVRRLAFPLLMAPHLFAFFGAIRLPNLPSRWVLGSTFFLTSCFQISDSMVFNAFSKGVYFVKAYPVLIAFMLTLWIFKRETERRFRTTIKLKSDAMIATIATQVAHDIRSPLGALKVATSDMSGISVDRQQLINKAVARIHDIANNLLNFAENPAAPQKSKPVLVKPLIESLLEEKRVEFSQKRQFRIVLLAEKTIQNISAAVDSSQLQRSLSNLINNSVEAYGSREALVEVALEKEGPMLSIRVTDHAGGVPEAVLEKIGERGNTYKKKNGHGLGLSSAKELAESSGGKLIIRNRPGSGVDITMLLPVYPIRRYPAFSWLA